MIDLSVSNLTKSFEQDKKIIDSVNFQIQAGERVGLLGPNGAGKTTVFRLLTGAILPDEGTVAIPAGRRLGLISQIPVYPAGFTVEDVLRAAFRRTDDLAKEMESLAAEMAREDVPSPALLKQYDAAAAAFEQAGGYETDVNLRKVASGLQIPASMWDQPFDSLSGGEKTRVNLARLILEDTHILLLDEPTNHLDLRATQWLEEYLRHFSGTVLVISHDRYFLDRVVGRVMELEFGKLAFYSGNYSFYVAEKKRRLEEQRKQYEKEQAKIRQLSETAQRMHGWGVQNEKLQKRAFAMEKRIERLRKTDRPKTGKTMRARFEEQAFYGDEVLLAQNLAMGFNETMLFSGLDLEVSAGERIALLGDNGSGKTTLLKTLLGEYAPKSGTLRFGPTVKIGYLPQVVHFSNPERNLVDTMLYETGCTTQEARDRLGAFLFQGEDVFKPVSALSGGEQSRLRLCMLMDEKINLLILDEPTNHLDLPSREWIEEALEAYTGCLLFVSHDRYFVRRFADRIWYLDRGGWTDFRGTYEGFLASKARETTAEQAAREKARKQAPKKETKKSSKKQLLAIEREIEAAEGALADLDRAMEAASSEYETLTRLFCEKEQLEQRLEALYETWEARSEEAEAGA